MASQALPPSTDADVRPALPGWIDGFEAAVWVVDDAGTLRYLSEGAGTLLGLADSVCGARCHEVVRGRDENGRALCEERCDLRRSVDSGHVGPVLMHRTRDDEEQVLLVVPIPQAPGPDEPPWIVHVALDATRWSRSMTFLETLVEGRRDRSPREALDALTVREHAVLTLLAEGDGVKRIAFQLGLSHATVRNHVQHVLEKLEVHSMLEAIALHVLHDHVWPKGAATAAREPRSD